MREPHRLASAGLILNLTLGACATTTPPEHFGLAALIRGFGESGLGCAYAVRADGRAMREDAAGYANPDTGEPLTANDRLDFGSVSKSFTAAVILELSKAGRLTLEDTVSTHVSDLPAWGRRVTLHDLLAMRSGVPEFRMAAAGVDGWKEDYLHGTSLTAGDRVSAEQIMDSIREMDELKFEPGERYQYSNSNYMLLRATAEAAGNAPFDQQMRSVARQLAGIEVQTPEFDNGYRRPVSGIVGHDADGGSGATAFVSHWDVLGASSVWASVREMALWGESLMADRERLEKFAAPGILRYPDEDEERAYGLGLMTVTVDGERFVYHLGGTEGFSSGIFLRPGNNSVLTFSCNMSPDLFFTSGMNADARSPLEKWRDLVFLHVWLSEPD